MGKISKIGIIIILVLAISTVFYVLIKDTTLECKLRGGTIRQKKFSEDETNSDFSQICEPNEKNLGPIKYVKCMCYCCVPS